MDLYAWYKSVLAATFHKIVAYVYRYEKFTILFFQVVETYRGGKLWMFVNLWVDGRIHIMRKIFRNT